ncbi:hypothetical protein BC940DRAFT_253898 [Gongronella butleri]|nr:hypothetical protein BC940DRAFT_253898 [Gongronella butleri]
MSPSLDTTANGSDDPAQLDNSDQVMDLFLHQVSEYNSQQLSYDNKLVHANNMHAQYFGAGGQVKLEQQDLALPLSSTPFMDFGDTSMAMNQDAQTSASTSTISQPDNTANGKASTKNDGKKGKGKGKEGGFLNVFSNPLLHAIPMLARNCLNFEDFLNQAALQGEQGLLGSKDSDKQHQFGNEYATPGNLMLNPGTDRSLMPKPADHPRWHVRVLGLPSTGAKSRVETQIKICLQLTNGAGDLAMNWSHLMLPEHMVARDKLKRKAQKSDHPSDDKLALNDADVLKLEAAVVCDSHPDNEIIMCTSCVHRERKRMKRKRDNKVARAANKEGSAAKLAALYAHELPDLSNDAIMAEERKKILLFNCSEFVEFNSGEATLPTRVTCYCRHHSEKVGFRLVFTIKDCHNHVLGTGSSPPIMITDDHKSSKGQSATPTPAPTGSTSHAMAPTPAIATQPAPATASNTLTRPSARKRARPDDDAKRPAKRKGGADAESDSGHSSPNTPATPASENDDAMASPSMLPSPSPSAQLDKMHLLSHAPAARSTSIVTPMSAAAHAATHANALAAASAVASSSGASVTSGSTGGVFAMSPVDPSLLTSPSMPGLLQQQAQSSAAAVQQALNQQQQQHQLTQNPLSNIYNRRRPPSAVAGTLQQQQQQQEAIYAKMMQKRDLNNAHKSSSPKLHRLIPSEGPVYGGSEVTVLGSNFYEGLTCLFGENPAVPTHCWSANTLLCILPPAPQAGPVVVSFKEHPLMLEGQDVVLFTYFDESDRALMELALQVVGLKTMGKVEDARQIAMRIVQGDSAGGGTSSTTTTTTSAGGGASSASSASGKRSVALTAKATQAIYDNARAFYYVHLEEQLIAALVAMQTVGSKPLSASASSKKYLSLTNSQQHTLLHLATICGFAKLVQLLIAMDCDVDRTDRNGYTALHFASWTGKAHIVKVLLTRNVHWQRQRTLTGKTAKQLAHDNGHHHIVALFAHQQLRAHAASKASSNSFASSSLAHPSSSIAMATASRRAWRSNTSRAVRVPLADIIPIPKSQSAIDRVASFLPLRIANALSSFYNVSASTTSMQQITQSVTALYTSMLDPF